QTLGDCFELLALDDGSSDGSLEICQHYASIDDRIRVLACEHAGLVARLEQGIEIARADLIARMDADDACRTRRFEQQLAYLTAHPRCVAVGGDMQVIDSDGHFVGVEH